MSVEILDSSNVAFSAILTIGIQLVGWIFAVAFKTEFHYDFFGGLNFIAVAVITLCFNGAYTTRQVLVTAMVIISRAELAGFLAYRVCQREGDAR